MSMTKEEKKEKKKAYNKAWYLKNKEAHSKRCKEYQANNKTEIAAYKKANKDKIKVQNAVRGKRYREANKLKTNIVYCIPNYNGLGDNYCGVSNQPNIRMAKHKFDGKLNTSEWYELGRVIDRKEAEALESAFHELGYHGVNEGRFIKAA